MDPSHLDDMIRTESSYWWHRAKRTLARNLVLKRFPAPGRLLEGGIGAGGNLLAYKSLGYQITGIDLMPESIEHGRAIGLDDLHVHDLCEPWPVDESAYRAVLLLDVVEHLKEPVAALEQAKLRLASGGGVVVTVPAYPWLMGPWDEALGHYRRYTPGMLKKHAESAGLRVDWWSYWNSFTLPPALLIRLLERFRRTKKEQVEMPAVSPFVNQCLLGAAAVERGWMKVARVPFGLSLVGVLVP